jgi:8-oxo-dGTP pyrophosphatase MutT (NUDIX family)
MSIPCDHDCLGNDQSPEQAGVEEFEELLEARDQELSTFQPVMRRTEADKSGDLHSFQRQLDKTLYLLVKKKRSSHCWQMPQGSLVEGESLLQVSFIYLTSFPHNTVSFPTQAAKRELAEDCGSQLKVDFLSSAPSVFLSYHHPRPSPSGIIGSKVSHTLKPSVI